MGEAVASAFAAGADDVVVADGGSEDATVAEAQRGGSACRPGARGRGPR